MNPVLLKPEADTRSQVVVRGSRRPRAERGCPGASGADLLWPAIAESLRSLRDEYELVVIEGAGSPAEINLADVRHRQPARRRGRRRAACCWSADIDRGGAFAHLFGTWALLPSRRSARGSAASSSTSSAATRRCWRRRPSSCEELTGVPTRRRRADGSQHGLPDEDGVAAPAAAPARDGRAVAVVALPDGVATSTSSSRSSRWRTCASGAQRRRARAAPSWSSCPAPSTSPPTCAWLRERGFEPALREHARAGGRRARDLRRHADARRARCATRRASTAAPRARAAAAGHHLRGREADEPRPGALLALARRTPGRRWPGCRSTATRSATAAPSADGATEALAPDVGWADGPVLGIAPHGLFEQPEILAALLATDPRPARSTRRLEELTDAVRRRPRHRAGRAAAGVAAG